MRDPQTGDYRQWSHFQSLTQVKLGAIFYDIDTSVGQSGSPVYIRHGDKIYLVGIHKGYSAIDNLNYCTVITKEITSALKGWVVEIKGSLE